MVVDAEARKFIRRLQWYVMWLALGSFVLSLCVLWLAVATRAAP